MSDPPCIILQNIFKTPHSPILVMPCACASLTPRILEDFLDTADDGVIGVAPAYGPNCALSILAFASSSKVLLVRLPKQKTKAKAPNVQGRDLLRELILCTGSQKFGLHMDVLATSLFIDLGLRLCGAVDLLSVTKAARHSLEAVMDAIGGFTNLNKPNVKELLNGEEKVSATEPKDIALRAWVAWRAATLGHMAPRLKKVPRIDTSALTKTRLSVFAKMVRDASRLSALKPTFVKNEIASEYDSGQGELHVTSTRFKTRVRETPDQHIEIYDKDRRIVSGKVQKVNGRAAHIVLDVNSNLPPGKIKMVTVGKEAPTAAEAQRTDIVLKALQGTSTIADTPFFRTIWLPHERSVSPPGLLPSRAVPLHFPSRPLNNSQKTAVEAILSNTPVNVIHGPPGTGKTTVIAAAVMSISASSARDRTVWLVAQSNVAVKNIAEKLASVDFLDFKLLVSKDFHYDWHEHLYEKINPNLIRSDELVDDLVATDRQLLGSKVVLCTLTMLSSPRISTITRIVPLQMVVVDEASQVEIGNYLPMINLFSKSLRKLVFIGDDKQLAPYGQGDVDSLQSVFEMKHLRKGAIFLDTQYRSVRTPRPRLDANILQHAYPTRDLHWPACLR
ncbi:hypothetical protein FB451DRAFT_263303 [Mycena latifolia]|nr:hypothetical protein FB451DRAFT_263303 [Mycena latifolia]